VAFTLTGASDFPSSAYVRIANDRFGKLHIAGAGQGPLDDIAGYVLGQGESQSPSRFGDYSAALIDGSTLWLANEGVTAACDEIVARTAAPVLPPIDCEKRDAFTNWGTFVGRIDLDDDTDH
jgi:hypothetical protein